MKILIALSIFCVTLGAQCKPGSDPFTGLFVACASASAVAGPTGPTGPTGPGSGTVTSIATTAPITGGTITATGTIACATCSTGTSTDTFTNKTEDVEGTGNIFTMPFKNYLAAATCLGTTGTLNWDTTAALAPTATCSAGSTETTMIRGTADFPDIDGAYNLQVAFMLPSDWTGAVDAKFTWQAAAITGDVVWQAATICIADGAVNDNTYNTASTVTDTTKGTTLQINTASITGITTTGCAAGQLMHFKVLRNRTHASDTIAGVVSLIGVEITTRRAM